MIRNLSFDEYPAVIKLWESMGLEIRLEGRDHPKQIEKQLKSGNTMIIGKFSDDRLLGVILVSHDGRKGWMNRLAVDPESRRNGIAKELISSAETLLFDEHGIEVFSALVLTENKSSHDFFLHVGYEKWEEVTYFSKRIRNDS